MARALEAILRELDSVYAPQRSIYNKQITALPGQLANEQQGLDRSKKDAYENIVTQANRRGVAFGGIPLDEQANYEFGTYQPAVVNLKNRFRQEGENLRLRLGELARQQRLDAYDIRNQELAQEQAAAARASGGGGGGIGGFNFGSGAPSGGGGGAAPSAQNGVPAGMQQLYNQMFIKSDGSQWGDQELVSDYNATYKSAGYGNERDKQKLYLYHLVRPDLFGAPVPISALTSNNPGY